MTEYRIRFARYAVVSNERPRMDNPVTRSSAVSDWCRVLGVGGANLQIVEDGMK